MAQIKSWKNKNNEGFYTKTTQKGRFSKLCVKILGQGGGGALQGNFGRYSCAAEIAKTPQCIYCLQMKPEFTCYNLFDNHYAIG
jgi:hypothetical protein